MSFYLQSHSEIFESPFLDRVNGRVLFVFYWQSQWEIFICSLLRVSDRCSFSAGKVMDDIHFLLTDSRSVCSLLRESVTDVCVSSIDRVSERYFILD